MGLFTPIAVSLLALWITYNYLVKFDRQLTYCWVGLAISGLVVITAIVLWLRYFQVISSTFALLGFSILVIGLFLLQGLHMQLGKRILVEVLFETHFSNEKPSSRRELKRLQHKLTRLL